MFFYLSKILDFILLPVLWIGVVLLVAALTKQRRRKQRRLVAGLVLLVVLTNPFLVRVALNQWERPYRTAAAIRQPYDYAIVLGGFSYWDGRYGRLTFGEASDRLMQALDLYRSGKVRKLVLSGGPGSLFNTEEREAAYLKAYLLRSGIPERDLLMESNSRNTHENAVFVARLLEGRGGSSLLVTSALHMRRAEACFAKAGLAVSTWPTDRLTPPEARAFEPPYLFLPSSTALDHWERLVREIVGYGAYALAGYV